MSSSIAYLGRIENGEARVYVMSVGDEYMLTPPVGRRFRWWGGRGGGTMDLARAILEDYFQRTGRGEQLPEVLARLTGPFVDQFLTEGEGEQFGLTVPELDVWLKSQLEGSS